MSRLTAIALALALALALPASAADDDWDQDPVLGPRAQENAKHDKIHVAYDAVAVAILEAMRSCIIGQAWGLPDAPRPPLAGVALADHCYRKALGAAR